MGLGRLPGACIANLQPDTSLANPGADRDETIESKHRDRQATRTALRGSSVSTWGVFYAFFFMVNRDRRRRVE